MIKYLRLFSLFSVCVQFSYAQITAIGEVKHAIPSSTSATGGVTLTVSGGTPPYTYTWTPGNINTKDISNVSRNSYTVLIKDNVAATKNYYYNLGYKMKWRTNQYLKFSNDTIYAKSTTPTGPYGDWASTVSRSTLKASQDGWIEFMTKSTYQGVIGLLDSVSVNGDLYDSDYIMETWGNALWVYSTGTGWTNPGTYSDGDMFRMQRVGTNLYIKVNNTTVTTFTLTSGAIARDWKSQLSVYKNSYVTNIGCSYNDSTSLSFPNYIQDSTALMVHSKSAGSNDGAVTLKQKLGVGSHTYSWSPEGEINDTIKAKAYGTYTVTSLDSDNSTAVYQYNVGYKTFYVDASDMKQSNDTLKKNTPYGSNYPNVVSKNILPGNTDGWIEYVISTSDVNLLAFMDSSYSSTLADVDYAFNPASGTLYIYSTCLGTYANMGSYKEGDIARLERIGSTVYFKINGKSIASCTVTSTSKAKDWKVKAALYAYGGLNQMTYIGISNPYYLSPNICATLKRTLDASYYQVNNNKLYVTLDGDYSNMTINWSVYKYDRTNPSGVTLSSSSLNKGDNRYVLDATTLTAGYYVLEVTNQKKEKLMLRFKK